MKRIEEKKRKKKALKRKIRKILNIILFVVYTITLTKIVEWQTLRDHKCTTEQVSEVIVIEEESNEEEIAVMKEIVKEETKKIEELNYRMTYYHTGDSTNSGTCTASGICTDKFNTNEFGWYTYNGKLVMASANKRLLSWDKYKNSNQKMFNLYDELTLTINGKDYEAIVLDVCGACMVDAKIDLFVKDGNSGLDTQIIVKKEM